MSRLQFTIGAGHRRGRARQTRPMRSIFDFRVPNHAGWTGGMACCLELLLSEQDDFREQQGANYHKGLTHYQRTESSQRSRQRGFGVRSAKRCSTRPRSCKSNAGFNSKARRDSPRSCT